MSVKKLYKENLVAGAAIRDDKGKVISEKYAKQANYIRPVVHKAVPKYPKVGMTYYANESLAFKLAPNHNFNGKTMDAGKGELAMFHNFTNDSRISTGVFITITKNVLRNDGTIDFNKVGRYIKISSCGQFRETASNDFIIEDDGKVKYIAKPDDFYIENSGELLLVKSKYSRRHYFKKVHWFFNNNSKKKVKRRAFIRLTSKGYVRTAMDDTAFVINSNRTSIIRAYKMKKRNKYRSYISSISRTIKIGYCIALGIDLGDNTTIISINKNLNYN